MKELLYEPHMVHLQNKRFSCKSSSESEESDSGKLRLTDFPKFFRFEAWKEKNIYCIRFMWPHCTFAPKLSPITIIDPNVTYVELFEIGELFIAQKHVVTNV
jgi:hypothetical protein